MNFTGNCYQGTQRHRRPECSGFRFYVTGGASHTVRTGQLVRGRGAQLLDHYLWVESLDQNPDPPDLFYKLRVQPIWMNKIPDHYMSRAQNASSPKAPCRS